MNSSTHFLHDIQYVLKQMMLASELSQNVKPFPIVLCNNKKIGLITYDFLSLYSDFKHFDYTFCDIYFWEDLWISQNNIQKARLNSFMQMNKKIFARNCTVKILAEFNAIEFLNKYHQLGFCASNSYLGLYEKDKLLALASFTKGTKLKRIETNKKSFSLSRFCVLPDISIVGGLTKLINAFVKQNNANDIMTYLDASQSQNSNLLNAGFELSPQKKIFEFYIDIKNNKRYYQFVEECSYLHLTGILNYKLIWYAKAV